MCFWAISLHLLTNALRSLSSLTGSSPRAVEGRLYFLDPAAESRLEEDMKMKGLCERTEPSCFVLAMDLHQRRVSLSVRTWCFILCRMLSHQQKGLIVQSLLFLQAAMTQEPMLLYLWSHALPVNFFFCGWSTSFVKASLELNVYRIITLLWALPEHAVYTCHSCGQFLMGIRM